MTRVLSLWTVLFFLGAGMLLTAVGSVNCEAGQPAKVEILFMNHGPMHPTIRNLKALLQRYPGKVQAGWFDFDQQSGKSFMSHKGITGHIPLLIFVNGSHTFDMGGRKVTFMGFPSGAGPYQYQGKWSLQDLEGVIQSLTR